MTAFLPIALLLAAGARAPAGVAPFEATFLYRASAMTGELPLSDVGLSYDRVHAELYVTGAGPVRVFNESGMEVFSFGESPELGLVRSIAAAEDGSLVALASRDGRVALVRCTFRGEFQAEIVPRNVPPAFAKLSPTVLRYHDRKIYLADQPDMRILVLDDTGEFVAGYDVAEKLKETANRATLGLRGFSVDRDGNVLFTIQPLFKAYAMTPEGDIQGFGEKGSAPGKLNIVGGITRDDAGYTYVADMLKSAIIVFDPELRVVKEFGYRGRNPGNLVAPDEIVAAAGKLFISNRGRRGVSVFRVGPAAEDDPAQGAPGGRGARRRAVGGASNPQ